MMMMNLKKKDGIYIIPSESPSTILYYNNEQRGNFHVCDESAGKWNNRTRTTMNHNVLAKNKDIICGGDFSWERGKLYITNGSGHYYPNASCLNYTLCLFKKYGFNPITNSVGAGKRTKRKNKLTYNGIRRISLNRRK